jgi:hypothetical protein
LLHIICAFGLKQIMERQRKSQSIVFQPRITLVIS